MNLPGFLDSLRDRINPGESRDTAIPVRKGRIPVSIITGFLGSGKTTLVNEVLRSESRIRAGVIVNDFGSVPVDDRLIEKTGPDIIALENGCVCCSLRGRLSSAVEMMILQNPGLDALIIEASGVSDPAGILEVMATPQLKKISRVSGVICLVDTAEITRVPWLMSHLVRKQIRAADLILLNKTDLVTGKEIGQIRNDWIPAGIPVLETVQAGIPVDLFFGQDRPEDDLLPGSHHHADEHDHGEPHIHAGNLPFSVMNWSGRQPVSLTCLSSLLRSTPAGILRAKGFVQLDEMPGRPAIIQVVGRRFSITRGSSWEGTEPCSHLVLIGMNGELDIPGLTRRLNACLLPGEG